MWKSMFPKWNEKLNYHSPIFFTFSTFFFSNHGVVQFWWKCVRNDKSGVTVRKRQLGWGLKIKKQQLTPSRLHFLFQSKFFNILFQTMSILNWVTVHKLNARMDWVLRKQIAIVITTMDPFISWLHFLFDNYCHIELLLILPCIE